jgi:hypothetical protein
MASRDSSVCIATGWTTEELRVDSRKGNEIFLVSTVSTAAVRPTHLPIQWVPESLSA